MTWDLALRLTEILLAIALIQQSLEHFFATKDEKLLFIIRFVLSGFLLSGLFSKWVLILLFINALFIIRRFRGPYNGGSDKMTILILTCLCLIKLLPSFQIYIFAFLAIQVVLSYFMPGVFKLVNPAWWDGSVLKDIFEFSSFPRTEDLRSFSQNSRLIVVATWLMLIFELAFPFALISKTTLFMAVAFAMIFHLLNHYLFGFNRFFWIWLAAYPSLFWFSESFIH